MTNTKRLYIIWMLDEDVEDWVAVSVADSEAEAMGYIDDRESDYDGLVLSFTETTVTVPSKDTDLSVAGPS